MATLAGNPNVRYCQCGNISILEVAGNVSEVHLVRFLKGGTLSDLQRYMFLTELRQEEGAVVHCKCCNTNAARVEGVDTLADLDKVTAVTIMDTIDEVCLQPFIDMSLTVAERITSSAGIFKCFSNGYPCCKYSR